LIILHLALVFILGPTIAVFWDGGRTGIGESGLESQGRTPRIVETAQSNDQVVVWIGVDLHGIGGALICSSRFAIPSHEKGTVWFSCLSTFGAGNLF
jgi:hypothetical protein